MQQYLTILQNAVNGERIYNERTNTNCFVTLNEQIKIDCSTNQAPLCTTRKTFWKAAINEMLCYIRGYRKLADFHKLGVKTWDANCKAWDPKGEDLGIIYGASAEAVGIGYSEILQMIKQKPGDRGIIWNFWNPEYFILGCLRPCMFSHQFNVVNGTLHLTSTQRSSDVPLGMVFNIIQIWFLLKITAHLTNLKPGTATLNVSNCHVYENQVEQAKIQLTRSVFDPPAITGFELLTEHDVFEGTVTDKLTLSGYQHHDEIKYPFTV